MRNKSVKGLLSCLIVSLLVMCSMFAVGCDPTSGPTEITYSELQAIVYDSDALAGVALIDVRPVSAFENGCIQNARNIDLEDLVDQYGEIIDGGSALTAAVEDKSTRLIVYCDGYGKDQQFAKAAADLGYTNVSYYKGGIADWQGVNGDYLVIAYNAFKKWHDANYPFENGTDYLISANLASWYTGDEVQEGHIPGAINIASPEMATRGEDGTLALVDGGAAFTGIVADQTAKVIFYCGSFTCGRSLDEAQAAVTMLGYSNVYRYQGGYNEWKDEGNEIVAGSDPY